MDERKLYETILGLAEPWYVADVEVAVGAEEIRVRLEPPEEATLVCPECGRAAPEYDRAQERRRRHLDTCQFRTIICARIPRVQCGEHGCGRSRVPWAVDLVRRAEQAELRERGADGLKRTRYLWLKGAATRSRKDSQRLQQLRRAGYQVGRTWEIKEAAGRLWRYRSMT